MFQNYNLCVAEGVIDSGMKEDLLLYGKELNYANAIWSAAYVFGQIPSNLLLTRVSKSCSLVICILFSSIRQTRSRIERVVEFLKIGQCANDVQVNVPLYIAFLEVAWTVFTFATAGVKDVKQLYVFRFLYVSIFNPHSTHYRSPIAIVTILNDLLLLCTLSDTFLVLVCSKQVTFQL